VAEFRKLYEYELGLRAICWTCGKEFTKTNPCTICEFFVCPHCGSCGCGLPKRCRDVARKIIETMVLNGLLPISKKGVCKDEG
jgi:hypothetical protein